MKNKIFNTAEEVETAFYQAIENCHLETMYKVWADHISITCIHPNGLRLENYNEIMASWQYIFTYISTIKISTLDKIIIQKQCIAIHMLKEELISEKFFAKTVATNIYQYFEEQGWKMILHHASPELQPMFMP